MAFPGNSIHGLLGLALLGLSAFSAHAQTETEIFQAVWAGETESIGESERSQTARWIRSYLDVHSSEDYTAISRMNGLLFEAANLEELVERTPYLRRDAEVLGLIKVYEEFTEGESFSFRNFVRAIKSVKKINAIFDTVRKALPREQLSIIPSAGGAVFVGVVATGPLAPINAARTAGNFVRNHLGPIPAPGLDHYFSSPGVPVLAADIDHYSFLECVIHLRLLRLAQATGSGPLISEALSLAGASFLHISRQFAGLELAPHTARLRGFLKSYLYEELAKTPDLAMALHSIREVVRADESVKPALKEEFERTFAEFESDLEKGFRRNGGSMRLQLGSRIGIFVVAQVENALGWITHSASMARVLAENLTPDSAEDGSMLVRVVRRSSFFASIFRLPSLLVRIPIYVIARSAELFEDFMNLPRSLMTSKSAPLRDIDEAAILEEVRAQRRKFSGFCNKYY